MSTHGTGRRHGWAWKLPLWILVGLALFVATGWWTLALFYAGPGPSWLRTTLALVFVGSTLVLFLRVRPFRRALRVWGALFLVLLLWWINLPPSNDRDWAPEVARSPSVDIAGDRLTFHDIRNFDYRSETDFKERYETRTVDLSRLVGLDLF